MSMSLSYLHSQDACIWTGWLVCCTQTHVSHRSDMQEMEMVIRPAVSGVENVLRAVGETPSVERVVLTSSVAAIVGDHWERGRNHVYTEADWNQTATQSFLPYHRQVPPKTDASQPSLLAYLQDLRLKG